jgi:hypothetical protein
MNETITPSVIPAPLRAVAAGADVGGAVGLVGEDIIASGGVMMEGEP